MADEEKDVLCPSCGQEWVTREWLPALKRQVFVCFECESLWLESADIGTDRRTSYSEFMRCFGRDSNDPNEHDTGGTFRHKIGPWVCPRCEEEWVRYAELRSLSHHVFMCGSCRALLTQRDDIGRVQPQEYLEFMARNGVPSPKCPDEVVWKEPIFVQVKG
jgi:transposase-like protein